MALVKIDFQFYNATEEAEFKSSYPMEYELLSPEIGKTLKIPLEDFKTFFLFRHQMEENGRVTSFNKFFKSIEKEWVYFDRYYTYDSANEDFFSKYDSNNGNTEISDSLGVAGALAVSSKIFLDITQADWRKIPVLKTKDFDFEHLSVFKDKYLVVEAKGAIVKDNRLPSSVDYHKKSVLEKKDNDAFLRKYSNDRDVCFALITVAEKTKTLKTWMVDPPTLPLEYDPFRYKLLSRLYFYLDYIRLVSQRSYISLLLANRIKILEISEKIDKYDKIPLINSRFEKIEISQAFIEGRTSIKSQSIVGVIYFGENEDIYFIGIHKSILEMLITQNFNSIINYKDVNPTTNFQTINCKIRKSKISEKAYLRLREKLNNTTDQDNLSFDCKFETQTNSAGITFGKAPFENIE